jgi:hypothetical protein
MTFGSAEQNGQGAVSGMERSLSGKEHKFRDGPTREGHKEASSSGDRLCPVIIKHAVNDTHGGFGICICCPPPWRPRNAVKPVIVPGSDNPFQERSSDLEQHDTPLAGFRAGSAGGPPHLPDRCYCRCHLHHRITA